MMRKQSRSRPKPGLSDVDSELQTAARKVRSAEAAAFGEPSMGRHEEFGLVWRCQEMSRSGTAPSEALQANLNR